MRAVRGDTESSGAPWTAAVPEVRARTGLSLVCSSDIGSSARGSSGLSAVLARARLPLQRTREVRQAQARHSWLKKLVKIIALLSDK